MAKALATPNKNGCLPLYKSFSLFQEDPSVAVKLLEAGADPYAENGAYNLTVFHLAIAYSSVADIRMMVWAKPNYEKVLDREGKTGEQRIIEQFKDHDKYYIELIAETASDSREVTRLSLAAKAASKRGEHELAAEHYQSINSIFTKHKDYEKHLPEVYSGRNYAKKRICYLDFYQRKATEAKEQAFASLIAASQAYKTLPSYGSYAQKQHQIKLLTKIEELAKELGRHKEATTYAEACNMLKAELLRPAVAAVSTEGIIGNPLIKRDSSLSGAGIWGLRRRIFSKSRHEEVMLLLAETPSVGRH